MAQPFKSLYSYYASFLGNIYPFPNNSIFNRLPPAKKGQGKIVHVRTEKKIGRNESCSCGSGLKYKKCCGMAAKSSKISKSEQ